MFEQAIRIEYMFYIQREKEKEEQRRIREQMKQEAEERKLLEDERKKIEKEEEEKYLLELHRNKEILSNETDDSKIAELTQRIALLESQYNELEHQKEEIIKRANGKAGHVYVISNFGSFGDQMFKIGMTRRLDPLERIDELGEHLFLLNLMFMHLYLVMMPYHWNKKSIRY